MSKKILPRSINLCKVVKSAILWENNTKDTFEILFNASEMLVKGQYNAKVKKYEELDREGQDLRRVLKEHIGSDNFYREDERIKQHMSNVLRVEKENKEKRILRDTKETEEIKKKHKIGPPKEKSKRKNRRFRRQHPEDSQENMENNDLNINVRNVNRDNGNLSNHVSRIHSNVKNLCSQCFGIGT